MRVLGVQKVAQFMYRREQAANGLVEVGERIGKIVLASAHRVGNCSTEICTSGVPGQTTEISGHHEHLHLAGFIAALFQIQDDVVIDDVAFGESIHRTTREFPSSGGSQTDADAGFALVDEVDGRRSVQHVCKGFRTRAIQPAHIEFVVNIQAQTNFVT